MVSSGFEAIVTVVSHGTMAIASTRPLVFSDDDRTTVDADGQRLLDALDDPGCRAILEATGDEALSANELSAACDLPLSTTYRKLELLSDTGLLAEGIRIRRSGKHTSEYSRRVDDVHVSVRADGGFEVRLQGRDPAPGGSRGS